MGNRSNFLLLPTTLTEHFSNSQLLMNLLIFSTFLRASHHSGNVSSIVTVETHCSVGFSSSGRDCQGGGAFFSLNGTGYGHRRPPVPPHGPNEVAEGVQYCARCLIAVVFWTKGWHQPVTNQSVWAISCSCIPFFCPACGQVRWCSEDRDCQLVRWPNRSVAWCRRAESQQTGDCPSGP